MQSGAFFCMCAFSMWIGKKERKQNNFIQLMNNKCVGMNVRVNTNNLFAEIDIPEERSVKKRATAATLIVIVWHSYEVPFWNFI